jgi:hypothetical protein
MATKPRPPARSSPSQRVADLQAQVDQVTGVLKENMSHLIERQERLESIDEQADDMTARAQMFDNHAQRTHRVWRRRACKWTLVCVLVALCMFVVLGGIPVILWALGFFREWF